MQTTFNLDFLFWKPNFHEVAYGKRVKLLFVGLTLAKKLLAAIRTDKCSL